MTIWWKMTFTSKNNFFFQIKIFERIKLSFIALFLLVSPLQYELFHWRHFRFYSVVLQKLLATITPFAS